MPSRRSNRKKTAWALLALFGAALQLVAVLHTCEPGVPAPNHAAIDELSVLDDHAAAPDFDCTACVLSSHTRSLFTASHQAIAPAVSAGLVPPCIRVTWSNGRFRDLSARSPPPTV